MEVIKDGIGRPLYNILSDGTRIDLLGNPITKQQSSKIKYSDYQTETQPPNYPNTERFRGLSNKTTTIREESPATNRSIGLELFKFSWYSFWIGFCFASLVWAMLNYFINYYNGIN